MNNLFEKNGALFSECRKYRFALWRIWDENKPFVMFVGLNPSTANENKNDATISTVTRFARDWGYGGVYMLNCFPFISTNPKDLEKPDAEKMEENEKNLLHYGKRASLVIFAWGGFEIVKESGQDARLTWMFPGAKALKINADGSPHHPLRLVKTLTPVKWSYSSR